VSYSQYYNLNEGLKNTLKSAALATMLFASPLAAQVNSSELFDKISKHEGIKQVVYKDTNGHRTIGIGFNLDDANNRQILKKYSIDLSAILQGKPITPVQIKQLYNESIKIAMKDANQFIPNLKDYPSSVQIAIINLAFNLGQAKLNQFIKLKAALLKKDYKLAAQEIDNSRISPNRKKDLIALVSSS
jgi:GH24 family phage-related lysozyme (muramidase)